MLQQAEPQTFAPKVLVVEDEFLIAMELRSLLQDGGFEVIGPVATVAAALEVLERLRPDACVLDVNLRGKNSAPVALVLKQKNVPFVLSSAYAQVTLDEQPALRDVINIGKPAPPEKLLSALATLLKT